MVSKGRVPELVIQFDMESYYDQFKMDESVMRKMCLCGPDGRACALEIAHTLAFAV